MAKNKEEANDQFDALQMALEEIQTLRAKVQKTPLRACANETQAWNEPKETTTTLAELCASPVTTSMKPMYLPTSIQEHSEVSVKCRFLRSSCGGSEASFRGQAAVVSDSSSSSLGSSSTWRNQWGEPLVGYQVKRYSKAPLMSLSSVASSVASCGTPRVSEDGGASCCSSPMGSRRSSLTNSMSDRPEQERTPLVGCAPAPYSSSTGSSISRTVSRPLTTTQQASKAAAVRASLASPTRSTAAAVKGAGAAAAAAAAAAGPKKPVSLATLKAQQRKAGAVSAAAGSCGVKSGSRAAAVGASKAVGSTPVKPIGKAAGTASRWK